MMKRLLVLAALLALVSPISASAQEFAKNMWDGVFSSADAVRGQTDYLQMCSSCHGPDLKGVGTIPGIAGRSPDYVVRQLYDFQSGARAGVNSALMKPVVEKLSLDDMIALAGYAASLTP